MTESLEQRVARAICCPSGICGKDGSYAICQAHTFEKEARAAIAECERWLPIASTPKDGTRIILYWPNYGADREAGNLGAPIVAEGWWCRPEEWLCYHFAHGGRWTPDDPTHWRPLPLPPTEEG